MRSNNGDKILVASRITDCDVVIAALRRAGWIVVRQTGSHIRLHKRSAEETLKLTVPAHRPIKRSTLAHILKHARLTVEQLNELL